MKARKTPIHQGWLTGSSVAEEEPEVSISRKGSYQYFETPPLVMECDSEGLAEEEWGQIESWLKRAVPRKSWPLQILISICTCRFGPQRPLQLRMPSEQSAISSDQRLRVSGGVRQHQHDDQPVRLEIVLRQTVRLA